jgi:hypothetical protein
MILTKCAVCATELGLSLGKKCGRCSTRYCGAACQKQHWEEGGHDKLCKPIKKAGGAEQYNANKKYTEAVSVAAEACAEDTKGQTCYICTQALHWKTKEGLVRGCSCRGTAGFAHVSCLAEQAKILVAEAEENNLDDERGEARWRRWDNCSLCEQQYHGVVRCALGWACWKTYLGRPERDWARLSAMRQLGNGLSEAEHHQDALTVREADLAMLRRVGASARDMLAAQSNIANTYQNFGRFEEAVRLRQEVYCGKSRLIGIEHRETLLEAFNYATDLQSLHRFKEIKALLSNTMPVARRVLGENDDITLRMRCIYAQSLYEDDGATLDDRRAAVTTLDNLTQTARRVLGGAHPLTKAADQILQDMREALRACEAPSTSA